MFPTLDNNNKNVSHIESSYSSGFLFLLSHGHEKTNQQLMM